MSDPGALRTRLVLEAPVETPDGAGGVARSFAATANLWAQVTPISARERVLADARGANVTHRIRIRVRTDLTTRHRFRRGARVWDVVAWREEDASGRFLTIDAQERVD